MRHDKRRNRNTSERYIAGGLRIVLALVLLLFNLLLVLKLSSLLQNSSHLVLAVLEIVAVVVAVNIQSGTKQPSYKLAWTLLIVTLPVTGLILYLLWGGNLQCKRLTLLPIQPPPHHGLALRQSDGNQRRLEQSLPNWRRMTEYLRRQDFLLYQGTDITYFSDGMSFFRDVLAKMAAAERFIFMEYYILAEGSLWDEIFPVLKNRAEYGVEIKIIMDDFGSMTRMPQDMIARLRALGIEVYVFNPVHRYVNRLYFNYRDHRKILCIDGQYAYTGGLNVGDEYVGRWRRFGEWRDNGICLDGEGAWGLTSQFIHMWEMSGNRLSNEHDYYAHAECRKGSGWCQPFSDGPINPDHPSQTVLQQAISNAHRYIWLMTPYFAVEDYVIDLLCIAAEGGVDVRLLLPGVADHRYNKIVTGSYYQKLLQHGVKIYEFTPGFLHGKCFLADDEVGMIGTINMDFRSFQINYECGVVLYGADALNDLRQDLESIRERSVPVDSRRWQKRSWKRQLLEKFVRLFSIWM